MDTVVTRSVADIMIPKGAIQLKTGELIFGIGFAPAEVDGYTKVKEGVFTPNLRPCPKRVTYLSDKKACCPPVTRMKCESRDIYPIDCVHCVDIVNSVSSVNSEPDTVEPDPVEPDEDYYGV